jgi:hypothetical protein
MSKRIYVPVPSKDEEHVNIPLNTLSTVALSIDSLQEPVSESSTNTSTDTIISIAHSPSTPKASALNNPLNPIVITPSDSIQNITQNTTSQNNSTPQNTQVLTKISAPPIDIQEQSLTWYEVVFGKGPIMNSIYRILAIVLGIVGYVFAIIFNNQAGITFASSIITFGLLGVTINSKIQ